MDNPYERTFLFNFQLIDFRKIRYLVGINTPAGIQTQESIAAHQQQAGIKRQSSRSPLTITPVILFDYVRVDTKFAPGAYPEE